MVSELPSGLEHFWKSMGLSFKWLNKINTLWCPSPPLQLLSALTGALIIYSLPELKGLIAWPAWRREWSCQGSPVAATHHVSSVGLYLTFNSGAWVARYRTFCDNHDKNHPEFYLGVSFFPVPLPPLFLLVQPLIQLGNKTQVYSRKNVGFPFFDILRLKLQNATSVNQVCV